MSKVWDVALNLLSFRDRTERELSERLRDKGFSEEEIERTIKELKELNYIDDRRYAQNYTQQAGLKNWGSIKLKQELRKKGIEEELLRDVEEEFKDADSELERALNRAKQLVKNEPESWRRIWEYQSDNREVFENRDEYFKEKQRLKAKLGRNLCGKGFEFDTISKAIDKIINGVGIEQ